MMAEIIWCSLIFGGIAVVLFVFKRNLKYKNLPPGPRGWPLVGNTFQQDPDKPFLTWSKWGEIYGDVFTVNNFGKPTVFCNSFEAIYEMYVTKYADFAGRPKMYAFDTIADGSRDIVSANFSPEWIRRKKVFVNNIKMYGDGLKHLEELMFDIIADLQDDINKSNQQPCDLEELFILAIANTLALLLLGHKYNQSDRDFQYLLNLLDSTNEIIGISLQSILVGSFPWLCHLPLPLMPTGDHRGTKDTNRLGSQSNKTKDGPHIACILRSGAWNPGNSFGSGLMKYETYDEDNPSCILDAYIKQHNQDMKHGAQYPIEYRHVAMFIEDFLLAGMATSRGTLQALFAILTAEQDIQSKVHEEIEQVIGGRHPELKDWLNMPFFHAVFEEVMRYCVMVPTSIPHKALIDSEICGHFIPKGTELISNIWSICHDAKVWGDPWTFRPERFLGNDGQMLDIDHPLRRRVVTFGAGRRKCPGENLARNRIFLITTCLLQKFHFKPVDESKPPMYDPHTYKFGLTIMPRPYKVIAVPRD